MLPEENVTENLGDWELGKDSLNITPKPKNKKKDQIKNFCF